jgi:hypothetical protein
MAPNLQKQDIFDFIVGDFRDAWGSLAAVSKKEAKHRGNFMFARQAMSLLEAASRLCSTDSGTMNLPCTGALKDLSEALYIIDKRYFTELPGPCADSGEFRLPYRASKPGSELLWAMFDLIRHGLGHQYQQTIVELTDPGPKRVHFGIELTGVAPNLTLDRAANRRPRKHLGYKWENGDLWLHVRTDRLFLDLERAIRESGICLRPHLTYPYMTRGQTTQKTSRFRFKIGLSNYYNFTSQDLQATLANGGHPKLPLW